MRRKSVVLFLCALMAVTISGCGGKKEEPKTTAAETVTETAAPETETPEPTETVSEAQSSSDSDDTTSKDPVEKKKKKKKSKKKAQETVAGETPDAAQAAAEERAIAEARAQAEAQARAEQERLAAEEQARLQEEEARRLAAEQAITEQNIPQDNAGAAPQEDARTVAQGYIGRTMEELIGAIGQPQGENRMPSCNGPGEDVQYTYPDFSVITYEENGIRTVTSIE